MLTQGGCVTLTGVDDNNVDLYGPISTFEECREYCQALSEEWITFLIFGSPGSVSCGCSSIEFGDLLASNPSSSCVSCSSVALDASNFDQCGTLPVAYAYSIEESEESEEVDTDTCFSPEATAVVYGKGKVKMQNLSVGDSVLVAPGVYDEVYTIDHHSTTALVDFVVLHTENSKEKPLEITARHMVYTSGKESPIPAGSITTSDYIATIDGPAKVQKISVVTRRGLVNPLTSTGRIVVDGILASTYSSFSESDSDIELLSYKRFPVHDLIHLAAVPYGWFCTLSTGSSNICNGHLGMAWASKSMLKFSKFLFGQHAMIQFAIVMAYVSFFGAMNLIILYPGILIAIPMLFFGFKLIGYNISVGEKIKAE